MATPRPLAGRKLGRNLRSAFRGIANGLHPATYTAYHHDTEQQPMVLGGIQLVDSDGQPVFTTVHIRRPEQHAVNHFRRLKRAWQRHGIDGLNQYLHSVGANAPFPQA